MEHVYDVVVVGTGIAGLSAAIMLEEHGHGGGWPAYGCRPELLFVFKADFSVHGRSMYGKIQRRRRIKR